MSRLRHVAEDVSGLAPKPTEVIREHGFTINQLIPQTLATADLPAADAAMDETVLIEDAGAGVFNLIAYAGGVRTRFTGTAF